MKLVLPTDKMGKKPLNEGLVWALTDKAKKELERLIRAGLDFDLAFVIIEETWSETDVFDLPPRAGDMDET